jgi:multidrug efflux pump subunit AcrA (membrane-fusion protein)
MNRFGIPLTWLFGVAGLIAGFLVSWVLASRRAARRENVLMNSAREQIAQSTQALRLTNTKLQNDLDKVRAMAAQGQTAALAEQRALVLHLQSQLRAANMEMDRLQSASPVVATAAKPEPPDADGFAMTRPFER